MMPISSNPFVVEAKINSEDDINTNGLIHRVKLIIWKNHVSQKIRKVMNGDGISKEISTKRIWNVSRWDQAIGRPKGKTEEVAKLRTYLDNFRQSVYSAKCHLMQAEKSITAESLKDFLTGNGEEKRLLLEIFNRVTLI